MASLIAAPDPNEARALLDAFARQGVSSEALLVGTIGCHLLPSLDMLLAVGGNGKAQYGVQTQYLIDRCPGTNLLLCAGAAGSLAEGVRVGDVVVASATVEHDYKNRFNTKPLPRHDADPRQLQRFTRAAGMVDGNFRVHVGAVASGDEDIVDAVRAAEVRTATGALCVAWEGSGGARAARLSGIGFCELRGISDIADTHAGRDFTPILVR